MKKNNKNRKILLILSLLLIPLLGSCSSDTFFERDDYRYNMTEASNTTSIVDLFQVANSTFMGGTFGIMILIVLFIMTFMGYMIGTAGDGLKSLAASSFVSFILSIFMSSLEFIPPTFIFVTLIMAGIFTLLLFLQNN